MDKAYYDDMVIALSLEAQKIQATMALGSVVIIAVDREHGASTYIAGSAGCVYASMGAAQQWLADKLTEKDAADD